MSGSTILFALSFVAAPVTFSIVFSDLVVTNSQKRIRGAGGTIAKRKILVVSRDFAVKIQRMRTFHSLFSFFVRALSRC